MPHFGIGQVKEILDLCEHIAVPIPGIVPQMIDTAQPVVVGNLPAAAFFFHIADDHQAAFGFLALLAVIAFVGIITLLKDLNTNEELPEVTAYPIVKEEVKTITAETKLEAVEPSEDWLIASVVMAEAEGEEMVGKVAVASVILNRCEAWNKTVSEVINEPNQFAKGKEPNLDCLRAVEIAKDVRDLYPSDMLYFRNAHYHEFGCPFLVIGHHYFSTERTENNGF